MKGNTTNRSARAARQRQTAAAPVLESEFPEPRERERAVSSMCLRAPQVGSTVEQQPLPGVEGVDRAKVARLRRAIEAGTLKLDAELVAQRIIEQEE